MYGSPQIHRRSFAGYDQEAWGLGERESRRQDPRLLAIAERVIARQADFESGWLGEQPKKKAWTNCFTWADAARVNQAYVDNAAAAGANKDNRCSCIVMLNVALGQLLSLATRRNPARKDSKRIVQVAKLTTETIELAMAQLVSWGYALKPTVMGFLNARGAYSIDQKPVKLVASVRDKVLQLARGGRCWYAFGLSLLDGYHSVLLLVDCTIGQPRIYWLDQFSPSVSDNVTASLDQKITETTQAYWQEVWNRRKKGYNTPIRLWPLRKPI